MLHENISYTHTSFKVSKCYMEMPSMHTEASRFLNVTWEYLPYTQKLQDSAPNDLSTNSSFKATGYFKGSLFTQVAVSKLIPARKFLPHKQQFLFMASLLWTLNILIHKSLLIVASSREREKKTR